jgi:hypothetical protein
VEDYEREICLKEEAARLEKYKESLEVVSLIDDEIEILNVLFGGNTLEEIKINKIIHDDSNDVLVDTSIKLKFKHVWCENDPYAYYLKRVVFSENGTKALLRYGWSGTFLDSRGFIAYFSKENNIWKKTDEILEWLS